MGIITTMMVDYGDTEVVDEAEWNAKKTPILISGLQQGRSHLH